MSKVINTTIQCPFCKCEFKVTKEDIKYSKEFSSDGTYHTNHYKYFCCPICGEIVNKKLINTTY